MTKAIFAIARQIRAAPLRASDRSVPGCSSCTPPARVPRGCAAAHH